MILSNRDTWGPASRRPEFTEVIMCHPAEEPASYGWNTMLVSTRDTWIGYHP